MFLAEDIKEDNYRGEVGRLVKAIQQIPTVTKEKRALDAKPKRLANGHEY